MTDLNAGVLPLVDDTEKQRTLRLMKNAAYLLLAVLALGGATRWWITDTQAQRLAERTEDNLIRSVATIQARPDAAIRNVNLPTTLRGYQEATIFARTHGYVSAWHKTIGDKVHRGELLASLSAPEHEQDLLQARAALEQVRARFALAGTSLKRWELQFQYKMIPEQTLDEKRSELQQAKADLNAAEANVKRLQLMLDMQRIEAPFDGVITRRNVDLGMLVTAGTTELFAMTQTDPLRLTVWLPQNYATQVQSGQAVQVSINEIPDHPFTGQVANVSGAIETTTRTRQVDVILPNKDGTLLPGSYAQVNLTLTSSVNAFMVPPGVLAFAREGPRVLVVAADKRIEYRQVKLGRDLGREIEVISGITAQDQIVINPSDLLQPGETVLVQTLSAEKRESGAAVAARN